MSNRSEWTMNPNYFFHRIVTKPIIWYPILLDDTLYLNNAAHSTRPDIRDSTEEVEDDEKMRRPKMSHEQETSRVGNDSGVHECPLSGFYFRQTGPIRYRGFIYRKRKVDKKGATESGIRPSPREISPKDSYVSCPVHKKTTNCKKSKKSSKARRDRPSNFKNKKCQASKSTVECSTSTCPPRRICINSQVSLMPNATARGLSMPTRQICNCDGAFKENCDCKPPKRSHKRTKSVAGSTDQKKRRAERKSKGKKRAKGESSRRNRLSAFCVCIGSPSYEQLRNCNCSPSCEILSKYNECCCLNNDTNEGIKNSMSDGKKKNSNLMHHKGTKSSIVNGETLHVKPSPKPEQEGHCTQNVFMRGLTFIRNKIEYIIPSNSISNNKRRCPVHRNCLEVPIERRCRRIPINICKCKV